MDMSKIVPVGPTTISLISVTIIALILQSCGSTKNQSIREWEKHEWKIAKEDKNTKPEWTIRRRKIRNSAFWEYRIEGKISASPKEGTTWYREEIHKLAKGGNSKKYPTYKILNKSGDDVLTYMIYNEPFPFKNTEMCVRYVFEDMENGIRRIVWKEAWNDYEKHPNKKLKRVESFRGSIKLSSHDGEMTQFVQTVQFDPKGMPKWLVNPMVTKFLKKELEKFRSINTTIKQSTH